MLFKDFSGDKFRLLELEAIETLDNSLVPDDITKEFIDTISRLFKVSFRIMSNEYGLTQEQADALLILAIIEARTVKL